MVKIHEKVMRTDFAKSLNVRTAGKIVQLTIHSAMLAGNRFMRTRIKGWGVPDMRIDMAILDFVQTYLRCDFLDMAMPIITGLGNGGILWVICSLILVIFPRTRKTGIAMAVSLVLEVLCCNVLLKPFVARLRPCDVNTAVRLLIPHPEGFSFPSGHMGASFAAAAALFFEEKRKGAAAFIIAALIGFSRIYLYVHYPTDVLAGALLGIMLGWLGNVRVRKA